MPDNKGAKRHTLHGLTSKVPVVPAVYTLAQAQVYLAENSDQLDTIDYIYVVDAQGKLGGVFSIKEMYQHPPTTPVSQISRKALVTARVDTDPEEIGYLALKRGIKAIPIVDEEHKLTGIIPHDTITKILHKELREDILLLAGVHRTNHEVLDNIMEIPLVRAVRHRLPWLIVGTLGGLLIAQIIAQYEETLRDNLVLAAFIPLVVYIADAVGTQLEAFVIRDFALFRKLDFLRYFTRQLVTVLALALLLGISVGLLGVVIYRQAGVAVVLGLAVVGATISACFSGLIVPYLFRLGNVDPANASGPLGTIIQDALSVVIYFAIAARLL